MTHTRHTSASALDCCTCATPTQTVKMLAATTALLAAAAVAVPATPDAGKVQVFIMMGQSNMLGEGKIGLPGDKAAGKNT